MPTYLRIRQCLVVCGMREEFAVSAVGLCSTLTCVVYALPVGEGFTLQRATSEPVEGYGWLVGLVSVPVACLGHSDHVGLTERQVITQKW